MLLVTVCCAGPVPSNTNDVLSGQDFLAVFMRSSQRSRNVPSASVTQSSSSSSYFINRNLIQHHKDGVDYEFDKDDQSRLLSNNDDIIRTSITKSTHIERDKESEVLERIVQDESEVDTTNNEDTIESKTEDQEINTTTVTEQILISTTTDDSSITTTTEQPPVWDNDTELPSQVVSVRVSSSVVRQRPRIEEKPDIAEVQDEPVHTAAAVQRSHFGVDDNARSVTYKITSDEPEEERVSYSQEATVLRIEGRQSSSRRPLITYHHQQQQQREQQDQQDSYADSSQEYSSAAIPSLQQQQQQQSQHQQNEQTNNQLTTSQPPNKYHVTRTPEPTDHHTVSNYGQAQALTYHPVDLDTHPGNAPVTYETSVSSATSGSRVKFYSEPPAYRIQAADKRKDRRFDLSQYQEKVYGEPEKNYEVDEAVSVMTNGRTHGVQDHSTGVQQNKQTTTTDGVSTVQTPESQEGPTIPDIKPPILNKEENGQNDESKVGYVVEDRNYRKYRVEEKTPDGFIVGEYGVVSHDGDSLRGVRYTAESNINPRLIYDALVKFLSLK
ncbi:hypothetical protein O3M35_009813 [Rhynocoris fuscipes]|uniref:Uncharacterized protein n=1 Tax=Rhynocoris fuscipes TaxID=488301 RepID=A0AAW1D7W6_9HEMI